MSQVSCQLTDRETPYPDHENVDDGKSDESHLDIKNRVREFGARIRDQKQRAGCGVDPKADPHEGKESFQRFERKAGGQTEDPQIDCAINSNDDSQANRVKEQDCRICPYRVRLAYPRSKACLFQIMKKLHSLFLLESNGPVRTVAAVCDRRRLVNPDCRRSQTAATVQADPLLA